mgnify:CR=1 FL=1
MAYENDSLQHVLNKTTSETCAGRKFMMTSSSEELHRRDSNTHHKKCFPVRDAPKFITRTIGKNSPQILGFNVNIYICLARSKSNCSELNFKIYGSSCV